MLMPFAAVCALLGSLSLGARCVIPRSSVRRGYVLERDGRWYVRLDRDRLVREHFATFVAHAEATYAAPLPRYV